MTTLFGHLCSRFATHPENLATEALCYILESSPQAAKAVADLLKEFHLPPLTSFSTQLSTDQGIPDLVCMDESGARRVIIEAKFWAGLTNNQPSGYVSLLPEDGNSVLLFVAPEARLHILWMELLHRCGKNDTKYEHKAPLLSLKLDGDRYLAATSWRALLENMRTKLASAGDPLVADVGQLIGLCDKMDAEAFLPMGLEEITGMAMPRRIVDLIGVANDIAKGAIEAGILTSARRVRSDPYSTGRYGEIGGTPAWFGLWYEAWRWNGMSPFWVWFYTGISETEQRLAPWLNAVPPRAIIDNGQVLVPVRILPNQEKGRVVAHALEQLRELAAVLSGEEVTQNG